MCKLPRAMMTNLAPKGLEHGTSHSCIQVYASDDFVSTDYT